MLPDSPCKCREATYEAGLSDRPCLRSLSPSKEKESKVGAMKVSGPLLLSDKDKTASSFPTCQLLFYYCTGVSMANLDPTIQGRDCHSFVSKDGQNETQVRCR